MESRLNHLVILVCLLLLLVYVDSKVNQHHKENDRHRHVRPHNMHRPAYEGYEWYKTYNRASDPRTSAAGGNKKKTRFGDAKKEDLTVEDQNRVRDELVRQEESDKVEKLSNQKNLGKDTFKMLKET